MNRFVEKLAIVTGAASGIGKEISRILLKHGLVVVGLDINEEGLEIVKNEFKIYPTDFIPKKCNVASEDEVNSTFKWICENIADIWVLVNCAGILIRHSLLDMNYKDTSAQFDVNVKGVMLCCKIAANNMIEKSTPGHIININSINGHYIRNGEGNDICMTMVYQASKHALKVLTEGLRREMISRKSMVKISTISPGGVNTPLMDKNKVKGITERLNPEDIAGACIKVLDTSPTELISELTIMGIHQRI